ncbi:hypothetical protein [Coraliomargarita parva]|uniref:hypothetical protein n=1 Tax=Coraliomargarita parva TaxID=3014050 RepID=UPI0022B5742C|nr:hypothetical protein [Coraliomargarita parva]
MQNRLVAYLLDNREQIVENWLTEAEVPPADDVERAEQDEGPIPLSFFDSAVNQVIEMIRTGQRPVETNKTLHMDSFLGTHCVCRARTFGGRACIELHDSGLKAFMSVFEEDWDTEHEFNALDREFCCELINNALSGLIAYEIEHCQHRAGRNDCPFAMNHNLQRRVP